MEARELRIGNIIKWNSTAQMEVVEDIATYKRCTINHVSIWDAISIALTEEWCIEQGFEKADTKAATFLIPLAYKGMQKLVITFSEGDIIYSIADYYSGKETVMLLPTRSETALNNRSVHYLQNLYFVLTGNELKIK